MVSIGQSAVAVREEWERKIELRLANGGASELALSKTDRYLSNENTSLGISQKVFESYSL